MNATQRIRLGLLLTNLKLGGRFSFRTFVNDKDYPKDPDPKNWRTIHGSKVHLTNGKIDGGAGEKFQGNEWHGKVAHGSNSHFPPKGWVKPPPPPKEPEPVPFGSEQPAPPKPNASGVPVAYINTLKGNFKKLSESQQATVKDLIKEAKKNGVPKELLEAAFEPEHHATIEKTIEALKAKQITPTAAQNVIAAAMYAPGNHGLKMLGEQWGGATPAAEDPFASKEVHLPKKKEPVAKSATTTKPKTPAASTKIDLTKVKEMSQHWDDMDEDDQSEYLQNLSGKFNIPTEKAALLMDLLQKPGFTDAKAEAKIKEWQKENGVPVGNKTIEKLASKPMQTPGLSSVDTSEKATGIKQAPGTLGLFKAGNYNDVDDPKWDNFTKYNKAQYDSLPAEEKASIKRYTQGSTHLRDYLVYGKVEGWGEYTKEALQKKVDNISNGLQKMKHPPMWVNRGASLMDWATADNPKGITKAQLKKMAKSGEVFTNDAFLSTNPTDKITYGSESVIRRFYVPEEASGGYIASGSAYKNEKEFLLDKKTKTRIMKVEEVNGTIITYEEVIP